MGAAIGWVGLFQKVVKGGPRAVQEIIIQRANDDLKLKPEQRAAVAKIVEETAKELGDATAEVRPKVEEIIGRAEQRAREVLDDEQRKKFDSFANQGRRRWKVLQEVAGRASARLHRRPARLRHQRTQQPTSSDALIAG